MAAIFASAIRCLGEGTSAPCSHFEIIVHCQAMDAFDMTFPNCFESRRQLFLGPAYLLAQCTHSLVQGMLPELRCDPFLRSRHAPDALGVEVSDQLCGNSAFDVGSSTPGGRRRVGGVAGPRFVHHMASAKVGSSMNGTMAFSMSTRRSAS